MTSPQDTVIQLFNATDARDWERVKACFSEKVLLDYSSFSQQPAAELTPAGIVGAWQAVLPGFEHTQHQISNFQTTEKDREAHLFCYGTARHYLDAREWIVVGTYDFLLVKDGGWKVAEIRFHFKYQMGDSSLVQQAIARGSSA